MTDDLAAFWEARLAEDEAAAVAAAEADKRYGGRPNWSALGNIVIDASDPDWAVVDLSPCFDDASVGAHIVRHDPARALRDVEADRLLISAYEGAAGTYLAALDAHDRLRNPESKVWLNATAAAMGAYEQAVKIRAAQFNDHPDYREDWKP